MKKNISSLFIPLFAWLSLFPVFVSAAMFGGIKSMLQEITSLINTAIPIAFSLGLIFFLYGAAQYILKAGEPASREKGRSFMIYGIVALFVMASVWGLVKILATTFGIDTTVQTGSGTVVTQTTNNPNCNTPAGCVVGWPTN